MSMLRSSCAYARLQYFALAVYLLTTLTIEHQFLSSWLAYAESWVGVGIIFELMVSICRKLSRGRDQKKKVPALAQLFQPPTNCNPLERRDVQLIAYLTLSIRSLVLAPSEIKSQLQWCTIARYVSSSSLQQGSKMYNRKPINVHPFREMYTRLWIHIHPLFIRHCWIFQLLANVYIHIIRHPFTYTWAWPYDYLDSFSPW